MPARKPVKKAAKTKATKKAASSKRAKPIKKDWKAELAGTLKQQGIAKVMYLSQDDCGINIPGRVSTGSLALDKILTNTAEPADWAGIPLSRITEIYGPAHIGKSTLLDQIIASVQRAGGMAALFDIENSRDRAYTAQLGVDLDNLVIPDIPVEQTHIESVLRISKTIITTFRDQYPDVPAIIGWDALGGTATQDEVEKGMVSEKATQPGAAAKAMRLASRLIGPELKGTNIAFVILNHEYENIGMGAFAGPKRKTFGGGGPSHLASLRIQLYSGGKYVKDGAGNIYGREIVAKIIKNRLGPSMVEARLPMIMGMGTDNIWTVFDDLKAAGVITTGGGWSAINIDGDVTRWQGWLGLRTKCADNPEFYSQLLGVWKATVGIGV